MAERGAAVPYDLWDSLERAMQAAREGNTLIMVKVFNACPTLIDARGAWFRRTPLMYAAESGQLKATRLLLYRGASINLRDRYGRTAIDLAAAKGHGDVVWLLLEWGADLSVRTGSGMNLLMLGADGGHVGVIKAWLWCVGTEQIDGKDVNGATALWHACLSGHAEVVRVLLGVGADPVLPNRYGETPMWAAQRGRHMDVIRALESFDHIMRLYRARATFEFQSARQRDPSTPVPSYLASRVAEGRDMPELVMHDVTDTPLQLAGAVACHVLQELSQDLFREDMGEEAMGFCNSLMEYIDIDRPDEPVVPPVPIPVPQAVVLPVLPQAAPEPLPLPPPEPLPSKCVFCVVS